MLQNEQGRRARAKVAPREAPRPPIFTYTPASLARRTLRPCARWPVHTTATLVCDEAVRATSCTTCSVRLCGVPVIPSGSQLDERGQMTDPRCQWWCRKAEISRQTSSAWSRRLTCRTDISRGTLKMLGRLLLGGYGCRVRAVATWRAMRCRWVLPCFVHSGVRRDLLGCPRAPGRLRLQAPREARVRVETRDMRLRLSGRDSCESIIQNDNRIVQRCWVVPIKCACGPYRVGFLQ